MDNINLTNKEIWDFLKNKMSKNGLVPKASIVHVHAEDYPNNEVEIIKAYYDSDVHNAIAIAYRSGYLRAMKGRPFKIGKKKEKKKSGHWEPVDPKNLPKEGTRVRYSRECRDYKNCSDTITLGNTGIVRLEGPEHNWFGISLDDYKGMYYNWFSFDGLTAKSLDMWVEDDE